MKRIASLAALAVLMAGSCPGQSPAAPAERPPLRVLSIGNSFSASLCRYLPAMAAASGEKLEFCNLFIGGCSLKRHAGNAAKAGADPAFAPYDVTWFRADDPAHPAKFRSNIPQMLATQKWDVVTLQQASHESWKPESFHPWADSLVATVRSLAPDAEIVYSTQERLEMVQQCRYVDEAVLYQTVDQGVRDIPFDVHFEHAVLIAFCSIRNGKCKSKRKKS